MARKVFLESQPQMEGDLMSLYVNKKVELDELTKFVKELGERVKAQMTDNDQKTYNCNGYQIMRINSNRVNWNQDALFTKVKSYGMPELIETVEQVCMPKLEEYILNDKINIKDLDDCQTITNTCSLRVTRIKEKSNE